MGIILVGVSAAPVGATWYSNLPGGSGGTTTIIVTQKPGISATSVTYATVTRVPTKAAPAPAAPAPVNIQGANGAKVAPATMNAAEAQLFALLNGARVAAGLYPLKVDDRLVGIARAKAQDMINKNYFDHWSPTYGLPYMMFQKAGIAYSDWGENLAGAPTVTSGFHGLMNSPFHKANMMSTNFTHVGMGVVNGGPYGMMIVMEFAEEN